MKEEATGTCRLGKASYRSTDRPVLGSPMSLSFSTNPSPPPFPRSWVLGGRPCWPWVSTDPSRKDGLQSTGDSATTDGERTGREEERAGTKGRVRGESGR
jgi:hypothetical protein